MSKTTIGNCAECGGHFEESETIFFLKGHPYHPNCVRKNGTLFELWRATDWRQKDIL